ncbi:MAG: PAS domain-containing protein [Chloroflexaceae bacterium]|jgi:rsbT co-antagonist protein RsbR|nr:PAS domain-containing protein [Chloroflexaceae bacterium]
MPNHTDTSMLLGGNPEMLQRRIRRLEERIAQLQAHQSLLTALLNNLPTAVSVKDPDGVYRFCNPQFAQLFGQTSEHVTGKSDAEVLPPQLAPTFRELDYQVIAEDRAVERELNDALRAGSSHLHQTFLIYGEDEIILGTGTIITEVTASKRAEQERAAMQQQVIEAQQAALRELSTPLIPITDDVVAMPLIGSIDSNRAQQVLETLLAGVAETRATTVILDITGVPVVDTQVASALLRAAQAVKLLGATVMLTGIRPEVAQTLVGLGLDMSAITTRSTLQSGIAAAIRRS